MTTEVLRNMLLTDSDQLRTLGLVVLDEVHYLQDPFRGGVWEEVLILTPGRGALRRLSATIGNARLPRRVARARCAGRPRSSSRTQRPINLHDHVALGAPRPDRRRGRRPARRAAPRGRGAPHRQPDEARRAGSGPGPSGRGPKSSAPPPPFRSPRRSELLLALEREDLLPVHRLHLLARGVRGRRRTSAVRDGLRFTTAEQRREIEAIAESRLARLQRRGPRRARVRRVPRGPRARAGPAPRRDGAGLPRDRRGLLRAQPARRSSSRPRPWRSASTCPRARSRSSGSPSTPTPGREFLTSAEFAQMTGRAGRRGLDDEGHAVVCFATEIVAGRRRHASRLAPPSDLHSSFRPTYNLTANLVDHFDSTTALEVVRALLRPVRGRPAPARRRAGRSPSRWLARHHVLEELGYARGLALTEPGPAAAGDLPRVRPARRRGDRRGASSTASSPRPWPGCSSALRATRPSAPGATGETPRQGDQARRTRQRPPRPRSAAACWPSASRSSRSLAARRRASVEERHHVPARQGPRRPLRHDRSPPGPAARPSAPCSTSPTPRSARRRPGDFVRQAKQVADLCEQLARLAPTATRSPTAARGARDVAAAQRGRRGHPASTPSRRAGPSLGSPCTPTSSRSSPTAEADGPAPVLHEPRGARVRPGQPARGRQGGAVRALLALGQEPAAPLPRRVRRRPRPRRATRRSTRRSASSAPTSSTSGSSSSTATTRSPSWAGSTWRASRRATS